LRVVAVRDRRRWLVGLRKPWAVAGFEFDEAVVAFAGGVGDAGVEVVFDAFPPVFDGVGEGDEFGLAGVEAVGQEVVAGA